MVAILNQNPQPRVPDEFEERLEDQMIHEYASAAENLDMNFRLKFITSLLAYYCGFIHLQNPTTFLDYYYISTNTFFFFFVVLTLFGSDYIPSLFEMALFAIAVYVVAELVILLFALVHLYSLGFMLLYSRLCFLYIYDQLIFTFFFVRAIYHAYQGYLVSRDLKQYQHGTRNHISIIPANMKGA